MNVNELDIIVFHLCVNGPLTSVPLTMLCTSSASLSEEAAQRIEEGNRKNVSAAASFMMAR